MTESEANPGGTYHERLLAFRRALIRDAIVAAGGNKSRAARVLGLQRTYLRLVRDLDLHDALRGAGQSPRTVALDARVSSSQGPAQPRGRARGRGWPGGASDTPGAGADAAQ